MSKRISVTVSNEIDKAVCDIASATGKSKSQVILEKLLTTRGFPRRDLNRFTRSLVTCSNELSNDRLLMTSALSSGNNSSIPTRKIDKVIKSLDKLNKSINRLSKRK